METYNGMDMVEIQEKFNCRATWSLGHKCWSIDTIPNQLILKEPINNRKEFDFWYIMFTAKTESRR
jgi:hypothetical protein